MSIKVKLSKWGNSNGIRIPKVVSEMLDLAEGDELFLDADAKSGRIVLIPVHPSEDKLQYLSELYHKDLRGIRIFGLNLHSKSLSFA